MLGGTQQLDRFGALRTKRMLWMRSSVCDHPQLVAASGFDLLLLYLPHILEVYYSSIIMCALYVVSFTAILLNEWYCVGYWADTELWMGRLGLQWDIKIKHNLYQSWKKKKVPRPNINIFNIIFYIPRYRICNDATNQCKTQSEFYEFGTFW